MADLLGRRSAYIETVVDLGDDARLAVYFPAGAAEPLWSVEPKPAMGGLRRPQLERLYAALESLLPPAPSQLPVQEGRARNAPRHTYDRAYVEIPGEPTLSMLDVDALPEPVKAALTVCREFEAQGAAWPSLLADPVRAWFRHRELPAGESAEPGEAYESFEAHEAVGAAVLRRAELFAAARGMGLTLRALADVAGVAPATIADEVQQMLADAKLGRAIREAASVGPDRPRYHISWDDGRGGCGGMFIEPEELYIERELLARAAEDLIDAADEGAPDAE